MVKNRPATPVTSNEIVLTRSGNDILISRFFPRLKRLRGHKNIIRVQNGVIYLRKEPFSLIRTCEEFTNLPIVDAGLLPAIRFLAEMSSLKIREAGTWPATLPPPNLRLVRNAWLVPHLEFLEWIGRNDRGVIRADNESQIADAIAQFARAWPELSITVVGVRREQLRPIAHHFATRMPSFGLFAMYAGGQVPDSQTRVALCTPSAAWQSRDVVFFLDAREIATEEGGQNYLRVGATRFYGFCDGAPTSEHEEDIIRAIFGFHELDLREKKPREIRLVQIPHDGRGTSRDLVGALDIKMSAIWDNYSRNRRISQFVKELAMGVNCEMPLEINEWRESVGCDGPLRVGIFVENRYHAASLAKFDMCGELLLVGDEFDPDGAAKLDVLLRADGLKSIPKILTKTLNRVRECDLTDRPFVIFDIADRSHPVLRKWKKARCAEYHKYGIVERSLDTVEGRVSDWLDRKSS